VNDTDVLLAFADLSLDLSAHQAVRAGRDLELTPTEFRLLEAFLRHPRHVLTRRQLLAEAWGIESAARSNVVDVTVSCLRRKVGADGRPRLIHTVRGAGLVLREGP
jgi:two-component system response regulator MprA